MNRSSALAVPTLLLSFMASALELSFYGRSPDSVAGGKVNVAAGVEPGVPVLFEASGRHLTTLRPATSDEIANRRRPIYRFEWQADKSARFYELADPTVLDQLSRQNAADTATPEGKKYELSAIQRFFDGAHVLQKCLPPKFFGKVTAYFVVAESGLREQVIVLPESSIGECIAESASKTNYPRPPHRFTAKADIDVKE